MTGGCGGDCGGGSGAGGGGARRRGLRAATESCEGWGAQARAPQSVGEACGCPRCGCGAVRSWWT